MRQVIYWSLDGNIPLLRRPPETNINVAKVVTESDIRPLFRAEVSRLKEYMRRKYGSTAKALMPRGISVVSQVKDYLDDMKSIYADGGLYCQIFFNPVELKWDIRLSKVGALRAFIEKAISFGYLWKNTITKGVYKITDFEKKYLSGLSNEFIILSPGSHIIGLGLLKGDRVIVIKKWLKPPQKVVDEKSTWKDFFEANSIEIEHKVYEGVNLIMKFFNKMKGKRKFIVTFSGGKDSSVVLSLATQAKIDFTALFNDTGLEHRETIAIVKELTNKLGVSLDIIEAPGNFYREVLVKGPPARDYRWCTDYLKINPSKAYFEKKGPAVNIVGLRRVESLSRSRLSLVFKQSRRPDIIGLAPILKWNGLHIWSYIATRRLPYNPLYLVGFERIGCYMCPSANLSELHFTRQVHQNLWSKWSFVLNEIQHRIKVNEKWQKYCLWRWKGLAVKKRELCKAVGDMSLFKIYEYRAT